MKEEIKKIVDGKYIFVHIFDSDFCGKKVNHLILEKKTNERKQSWNFANSISKETHHIIPCNSVERQIYLDEEYKTLMHDAIILTKLMSIEDELKEIIEDSFTNVLDGETLQDHIVKQVREYIEENYKPINKL